MKVGIDISEIERLCGDEKILSRIASENEKQYVLSFSSEGRLQRIASLWCVKEAVFKCLEVGKNSGAVMRDIELCHKDNGKPYVVLSGYLKDRFEKLELSEIEISISHSKTVATAIAVAR